MKLRLFRFLFALCMLLVFAAACEPDVTPTDDTPVVAPTAETNSTTPPTALSNSSPTAVLMTAQPATTQPGIPATPTAPPASSATALPNQNSTPAPTAAPTNPPAGTTPAPTSQAAPPTATQVTPTTNPLAPTSVPATSLLVVNKIAYMDTNGDFHVVGEVKNNGTTVLTQMELNLVIKDASGKSLLKDNTGKTVDTLAFRPMLTNLAPGESSPFGYVLYYDSSRTSTPDVNSVTVTASRQNNSAVTLASVEIQGARMVSSDENSYLVSGVIVNKGSKPAVIHDVAAALSDADKNVIDAEYSVDYTAYLAPAGDPDKLDSTPFYLRMSNPASQPADWKIYLDVEEANKPNNFDLKRDITNHYFDSAGTFHIVGNLTNNSSVPLTSKMVAGLYDKNNAVLDSYSIGTPVNIRPGEVIPFDISTFENVNNNANTANNLDHFTVQVDSYHTFTPAVDSVTLTTANDTIDKKPTVWTVSGKVTNTAGKPISIETVLVGIYDGSGKLMAVDYGWNYPNTGSDSIPSGGVETYTVDVPIDPTANVTGYTIKTVVRGELK